MQKVCEELGFKLAPVMALEAYLYSRGGFATQGKGSFELQRLLSWISKRKVRIQPTSLLTIDTSHTRKCQFLNPALSQQFAHCSEPNKELGDLKRPRMRIELKHQLDGVSHSSLPFRIQSQTAKNSNPNISP